MIEVRLFATFREGREKIVLLDADAHKSVDSVLHYLKIDAKDLAICLVNGFHAPHTAPIKDGDVLALFPPVGGG